MSGPETLAPEEIFELILCMVWYKKYKKQNHAKFGGRCAPSHRFRLSSKKERVHTGCGRYLRTNSDIGTKVSILYDNIKALE